MGQLQEKYKHYREPQKFMEADVYPYFRAIEGKQGPLSSPSPPAFNLSQH